jgi:hypothetical protein
MTPGQAWDVAIAGERAFIAGGDKGVHIVDISDPSSPHDLGFVRTHSAQGVAVSEDRLFVADGLGGLLILKQSRYPPEA